MAEFQDLLSADERRRAQLLFSEEHRNEFVLSHVALRTILANLAGMRPSSIELFSANGTKPCLSGAGGNTQITPNLRFNLSHTRGMAIVCVSLRREVGVDVEWSRPLEDIEGLATTVMSEIELIEWRRLAEEDRQASFYRMWTRKEAYLKAIGLGLFHNPVDVTVPISTALLNAPGVELLETGVGKSPLGWNVCDVLVGEGYSGSVCWEKNGPVRVEIHDFDFEK